MEQLQLFDTPPVERSKVYIGARNGFIKIGMSDNPTRRAKELGLTLLRVKAGGRSEERLLHERFRTSWIDREWFMPTPDLMAFLAA